MELRFSRCSVALLLLLFVAVNALRGPGVPVRFLLSIKLMYLSIFYFPDYLFMLLFYSVSVKFEKKLIFINNIKIILILWIY